MRNIIIIHCGADNELASTFTTLDGIEGVFEEISNGKRRVVSIGKYNKPDKHIEWVKGEGTIQYPASVAGTIKSWRGQFPDFRLAPKATK